MPLGALFLVALALSLALCAFAGADPVLSAPQDFALAREDKLNTLTWMPVKGAVKYQVYAANTPTGAYKLLATPSLTAYVHKNAPVTKFYKVRAVGGAARGDFSQTVGSVAPATEFSLAVSGEIHLAWKPGKYATGVTLERADSATGPWTTVEASIGETAYTLAAQNAKAQFFRLVSEFNGTASGVSAVRAAFEPLGDVRVICEESYTTGPTNKLNVVWNESVGASGYAVYRAQLPSDTYEQVAQTTETYYPDTRLPTAIHAYKVRPIYGSVQGELSKAVTLLSHMPGNVLPDPEGTSASGIVLVVNKKAQVVTAYIKDQDGEYTLALRHMICSTGKVYDRTPNGVYVMASRKGEWYRYPSGVYIRYPSIYKSGLFFHSVLYSSSRSVMSSTVGKLGTRQSLGCVRLKVSDAKWVYDHCTNGTRVEIIDGKSISALRTALKARNVKVKS